MQTNAKNASNMIEKLCVESKQNNRPSALVAKKGTFSNYSLRTKKIFPRPMYREEALKIPLKILERGIKKAAEYRKQEAEARRKAEEEAKRIIEENTITNIFMNAVKKRYIFIQRIGIYSITIRIGTPNRIAAFPHIRLPCFIT